MKADRAKGAWSADGNILIKDFKDKVHRLSSVEDLAGITFPPKPSPEPTVEAAVFMDYPDIVCQYELSGRVHITFGTLLYIVNRCP